MTVPHRSQGFGGKYLAGLGIDYLKKASVQCNGYPISHALINGFNGPPPFIPAEQPVSICPEAVKRAGPVVPDASCACLGSWSILVRVLPSGFTASSAMPGESFQSRALAVDQPARSAAVLSATPPSLPGGIFAPVPSFALVVGHPASGAVSESPIIPGRGETAPCFRPSVTVVVGQPLTDEPEGIPAKSAEKETLSNVRSADARRAQICRPIGVTRTFQTVL